MNKQPYVRTKETELRRLSRGAATRAKTMQEREDKPRADVRKPSMPKMPWDEPTKQ